jgi:hypothetical protein
MSTLACAHAVFILVSGLVAGVPARGADTAPPQSLSAYRDKNRVLLVFAPSAADSRYKKQSALFSGKESGLKERDLVRINVFEKPASSLRQRYGVGTGDFRVILVGKDGHTAYSTGRPVVTSDLFRRIDRMPMRRDEMRRRGR